VEELAPYARNYLSYLVPLSFAIPWRNSWFDYKINNDTLTEDVKDTDE
jgi:hypothetical protein